MIRVVFRIFLTAVFSFTVSGLQAQTLSNKVHEGEVFSSQNGLSSIRINVNFIDSRGYLWVGTIDGLNRYDGYGFQVFKHDPSDSLSLSDSNIRCISEDDLGNLWIGTNNGLNKFDRSKGVFHRISYIYTDASIHNNARIDGILIEDSLNLWLKLENSLARINLKEKSVISFSYYSYKTSFGQNVSPGGLVKGVNNLIWFGTMDGLFSFNSGEETFQHYFHDSNDPFSLSNTTINSIIQDRNGELWIGTDNGLNKYDRLHKRFKVYTPSYGLGKDLFSINSIYEDEEGRLWFATNRGMAIFSKRSNKFSEFSDLRVNSNSFVFSSQNSLIIDSNKIVWMGGYQGLIKIDLKPKKIELLNLESGSKPSLERKSITAVYKDSNENLWLGYFEGGLSIVNPITEDFQSFELSMKTVQCFFEDSRKRVWIGSSDGIFIYLPLVDDIYTFDDYFNPIPGRNFIDEAINEILQDSSGNIWIGTSKGLYSFEEKIHTVDSYNKIYNKTVSVDIGNVYSMSIDKKSEIWIGTEKGILLFNPETNVFFRPDLGFDKRSGLDNSKVYSLLLDSDETMWLGTNYGLYSINEAKGERNHYTEKSGLVNNSVLKLLEDMQSNIWLSSNRGLSKFDKLRNDFVNYGLNDGLQSYEFNRGCGTATYDGELYFGGESGLNSFYPDEFQDNIPPPKVQISMVEIFSMTDVKYLFTDENTRKIDVKSDESFSIRFSAMDFSYPEQNRFMYSLVEVGKKDDWLLIGNEHRLIFSNLPSGEYIFKLQGSTGSSYWNEDGASLKIKIEASFWLNRIAYFIYGILALLILYLFFQYRTLSLRKSNRILRKHDIIAREVSRQKELLSKRNKDIEDSMNYAYRIQSAMFITPKMFKKILPESFILYKPKDIVSGDFYWISETRDKAFVAAIDCTGHGVPGAFMSLIGFELFRKIINLQGVDDPGTILNYINDNIQEVFGKEGDSSLRDGMDVAFCVIDKKNMVLNFSGAFNPLYIIRDNKLIEIKGAHFSIGADSESNMQIEKKFKSHKLKIHKNDMIYMFSDGYADQFGGPEGKKYKYRRFRHLLLTIHKLPMAKQQQYLNDSIEDWKGDEDQVDDIVVIGISPNFEPK